MLHFHWLCLATIYQTIHSSWIRHYINIHSVSTSWGVGNCSLKVDDAVKGYTGGPKERERLR